MAGARSVPMINSGNFYPKFSGRPIPKRGRVKLGIVVGLAHSVASIFSLNRRWRCADAHEFS
ncbi:hypothetical protein I3760_10G118800 [Carya illinoinensis]|uniref:Uncharacterized protein n=1 Tax=Carya illinoinensis TaxID=32201 RepID=A0A922J328_CARIL|nr:hypothetical protein I3760_10G118800 [Carya illinoinensis]KAG6692540.1 hypothetical protein I3842_10G120000 [Carya illinoinensis]